MGGGGQLKSKKISFAFTLAEILITLSVIGIIAALTIPSLIVQKQKQEYVVGFQKAYNTVSSIFLRSQADNGAIQNWEWANGAAPYIFEKYLLPYLNISKNCKTEPGLGCFAKNVYYKDLNGDNISIYDNRTVYKVLLADSSSLYFGVNTNCISLYQNCGYIVFDVNGHKGPNTVGRDVFAFFVYTFTNEILPGGIFMFPYDPINRVWAKVPDETIDATCKSKDAQKFFGDAPGSTCGAKIIRDGFRMNY